MDALLIEHIFKGTVFALFFYQLSLEMIPMKKYTKAHSYIGPLFSKNKYINLQFALLSFKCTFKILTKLTITKKSQMEA
jgi:hypothetical protein